MLLIIIPVFKSTQHSLTRIISLWHLNSHTIITVRSNMEWLLRYVGFILTLLQATKALRESRGIALLCFFRPRQ
jgi:hypothetical protein